MGQRGGDIYPKSYHTKCHCGGSGVTEDNRRSDQSKRAIVKCDSEDLGELLKTHVINFRNEIFSFLLVVKKIG